MRELTLQGVLSEDDAYGREVEEDGVAEGEDDTFIPYRLGEGSNASL